MALHNDFGKHGEILAKQYLLQENYVILAQNWRYGRAEIDLIASINNILVFIEVKTRSGNFFGQPEEFVTNKKQELFTLAAEEYIYLNNHNGEIRFDVISILFSKTNNNYQINHIKDAFWNY